MAAETAVGGWGQCITAGSLGVPLGESTPGLGSHWRASVTYAREVSSLILNVSLASLSKCGALPRPARRTFAPNSFANEW